MKLKAVTGQKFFKPAFGAALAALCGLVLWGTAPGDAWVNASYDFLFRFGSRAVTHQVVLVLMDNEAYGQFHQVRDQPWDRALHAKLLDRLADDGCSLAVFDTFFREPRDPAADAALAAAMRRVNRVVLMGEQADMTHPDLAGARPLLPSEPFLSAAGTNWGVAWLDPDLDSVVRRHWPDPAPGPYPSLPWTAARLMGARLDNAPRERWLRYYGRDGGWTRLSYRFALTQPANYFRGKIVFIGNQPKTSVPDGETDKFRTPYTRWTGEASGGLEILASEFLNLLNGEWLQRPNRWVEALIIIAAGAALGGGLCRLRLPAACALGAAAALAVMLGAVWWSYHGNFWFPWLVIAGGQIPCALVWASLPPRFQRQSKTALMTAQSSVDRTELAPARVEGAQPFPVTPDYELFTTHFGEEAYGKVWLARNAIGQWQALKTVYLAKFAQNPVPYLREFDGIRQYKPLSDRHPALLRVDFVSRRKKEGYFYYVMELGDSLTPGWEQNPLAYRPRDLANVCAQADGRRLPAHECVRIGLALAEGLDFLHQRGLIHRDIKPQNIIFVNGQPKLADIGLVAEARAGSRDKMLVGTLAYMPPAPEPPGTLQADIYGLGMVLYVIHTGHSPDTFSEFAAAQSGCDPDAPALEAVILKACQPDRAHRYASAPELRAALLAVRESAHRDAPG